MAGTGDEGDTIQDGEYEDEAEPLHLKKVREVKGIEPNPARFVDHVHGSIFLHDPWKGHQFFFAHFPNLVKMLFQLLMLGSVRRATININGVKDKNHFYYSEVLLRLLLCFKLFIFLRMFL